MVCISLLYIFFIIVLQYNYIACLRYYFDEHLSDSEYIVESVSQLDIIILQYMYIALLYYLLLFSFLFKCMHDFILSIVVYNTGAMQIYSLTGLFLAYPIVAWLYDIVRVVLGRYPIPVMLDN